MATGRWTFTRASPIGDVASSWELTADAIAFRSDGPFDGGDDVLRWEAIGEAGTTVVDLPGGGHAVPDMASAATGRIEWLVMSRAGGAKGSMRPLPSDATTRDAIVDAMRARLGARWVGERLALADATARFGVSAPGDTVKVVALVASVLAMLVLLLIVIALLLTPVVLVPVGLAGGGWLAHRGWGLLRDSRRIGGHGAATVAGALPGLVEIEGRVHADAPSIAAASGRPCAWWDVAVEGWHDDDDHGGEWRQMAARHGGDADALVLADDTGRVPVWLRDVDLVLAEQQWTSDADRLPDPGIAMLDSLGIAWTDKRRVRERRMEVGAVVRVLGTLGVGGDLPAAGEERGIARIVRAMRTGAWRMAVVRATPAPLKMTVAVTIGFLGIVTGVGRGGERARGPRDAAMPPALGPSDRVIWKGAPDRVFIVSDRPAIDAAAHLRTRAYLYLGIGGAAVLFALNMAFGRS